MASKIPGRARRIEAVVKRLTAKHKGQFAAIDPRTDRCFLGADHLEVLLRARSEMPSTIFELKRLGSPCAFSVK